MTSRRDLPSTKCRPHLHLKDILLSKHLVSSSPSTMSARTRPTSQSNTRPRPPLESLIYTCLPSLAPSRPRPSSSASSSRPSSRIDHGQSDPREEAERQERVKELMEFCEEILDSRLPSSAPLDIGTLPDTARRLLSKNGDEDTGLRFNGSWNKLEKGVRSCELYFKY